ncbi:MAG TPA: hypothetical protein VK203_10775 [Nostocaceae cyanobacterium]|nr:hypothetical protein [Nostocaceae cyanobacterium]
MTVYITREINNSSRQYWFDGIDVKYFDYGLNIDMIEFDQNIIDSIKQELSTLALASIQWTFDRGFRGTAKREDVGILINDRLDGQIDITVDRLYTFDFEVDENGVNFSLSHLE